MKACLSFLKQEVAYADGDARRLLNTLETLAVTARAEKRARITDEWLLKVLGERRKRTPLPCPRSSA